MNVVAILLLLVLVAVIIGGIARIFRRPFVRSALLALAIVITALGLLSALGVMRGSDIVPAALTAAVVALVLVFLFIRKRGGEQARTSDTPPQPKLKPIPQAFVLEPDKPKVSVRMKPAE
jgi:uncharacterized membrane protein YfcA